MSFNVSALGAYTKESVEPLLMSAVTSAETQALILKSGIVLTGVKGPQKIPLFDTDAVLQDDSCGWDPSGATTISQREITVGKIKIEEALCPKDLEAKFTVEMLRAGSTYESFTPAEFEKAFLERKNEHIARKIENLIWQGDTGSTNNDLNKIDGLQKLINAGSPVSANTGDYTSTTTAITSSNILAIVKQIKNKIPAALKGKDDVVIGCGYDVYDLYVDAGVAANYFHYPMDDKSKFGGLTVPGTNIKLKAVHGLDGTGDLYAFRWSNVALAVDLENDPTNYQLWYSQDNNEIRFRVAFKVGTNVAFTSEVVQFKGSIS
jgi:hypothetical protein